MAPLEDIDISRQLGAITARLENIEHLLAKLPCVAHGEALARQNGQTVFFGMLGGFASALTSSLVLIAIWMIKGK